MLALAIGCATAPAVPDRPLVPERQFAQRVLNHPSGIRILVQEDHAAPLVSVVALVGAGSAEDPVGQEDLAHLVEHLSYRQIATRLKRAGATFNATTQADWTTFFALAHRDQLHELVALEGIRFSDPLAGITPEVFETERDVVRNERRGRGGDPSAVSEVFKYAFSAGHPLVRSYPAGGPDLSAVTLPAAQRFVERHYHPTNVTVVIAGDVNADEVAHLVGRWPLPPSKSAALPAGPAQSKTIARSGLSGAIHRSAIPMGDRLLVIAWPLPAGRRGNDPFVAMSLAALKVTVGYRGVVNLIESRSGSLMVIEAKLDDDDDPEQKRDALLEAAANMYADAGARASLEPMKWVAATTLLHLSSELLVSAMAVARHYADTGRSSFYRDALEGLAAVKEVDVIDFLWSAVERDKAISVLFEPQKASVKVGGARATIIPASEIEKHDLVRDDAVNLVDFGNDRLGQMVRTPGLASLPQFRLSNGMKVILVSRARGTPVADLTVQLPIGNADIAPFGLASLADDLSRNDNECREQSLLPNVGGMVWSAGADDAHRHAARVFSGNLANGFVAIGNLLRCRVFDHNSLDQAKRQLRARAGVQKSQRKTAELQAAETFWSGLYPDRTYGLQYRDTPALQELGLVDFEAAMRAQYQPAGTTAVVVTDRPAIEVQALMEKHLGLWSEPPASGMRPAPEATVFPGARTVRVFQADSPQLDAIHIGCRLPHVTDDKLPAHDLLAALVRREADEVRVSWGATYGLEVEVKYRRYGVAHLEIEGLVDPSRTADAVARLLAYLGSAGSEGPNIKSFLSERWDLGREFNRRFATSAGMTEAILQAVRMGWSPAVWDAYPMHLAQLSRAAVRDLLAPCAGREIVTVIGDKAKLTAKLAPLLAAPEERR